MLHNEITVYRFEDKTFEVSCIDADNAPIDFSSGFDNIGIFVYNADRSTLAKYSRKITAGWKSIDTSNQATGKLSFIIDSDTLKLAPLGKKFIEVIIRKTSAIVSDSKYDSITSQYLFTLKQSISSITVIP
jgi:hypothetical protein